jgi:sigma-B regulation protein RsbU (phosphoserine phosphatase)
LTSGSTGEPDAGGPSGPAFESPAVRDRWLDSILEQALFQGIPAGTIQSLISGCEIRLLQPGEVLLEPGQRNQNLYLLLDGQAKVHIDRIDTRQAFLIDPGECMGEISIIDGKPATAFVVAHAPAHVLVIPESILWSEFLSIPGVAKNFMRLFAERFRARNQAMLAAREQQLRLEQLQKELAIAQDIQLGMLPRELDLDPAIEIAASMTPAQQVGGDFFDAFPVNSDEFCIAVGDVSGKGVPAALFMVRTMGLLRNELLKDQSLDRAVGALNRALCEDNPTCMFTTLVCGVLNVRDGSLRYMSAGHDPVILGRRGAAFAQLPRPRGVLLGVDEDASYALDSVVLSEGDMVLLYTDGVTEAMNERHELFSLERLLECLNADVAADADSLAFRIKGTVEAFVAGAAPSDDLTTLVLRYRGRPAAGRDQA